MHKTLFTALLSLVVPAAAQRQACWDLETPCPQGRFEGPTLVIDDLIYVFGGFGTSSIQVTSRVDVYDPAAGTWSSRADLPTPVTHIGVARDDREVWIAGGFVGDHPGVATAEVWIYDVDLDRYSSGPPLPKPVAGGGLARLGRSLHWFGGVKADRDTDSPDHWALDLDDPASGWQPLAPLPDPRCHVSAAVLAGRIHAIGGQFGHDSNPVDTDLHHAYDVALDQWDEVAPLPCARSHFEPGTVLHDDKVLIVGGRSSALGLASLIDVTEYDPALDLWRALPSLPEPRLGVGAGVVAGRLHATTGASANLFPNTTTWSRPVDASHGGKLRLNGGGDHYVSPVDASEWCSDFGFEKGNAYGNFAIPDIHETDDDELYKTHRYRPGAPLRYRLPRDEKKYRVVLHFAESYFGATGVGGESVGKRIMDVEIEGETVREDLDVAALVGVETALRLAYDLESEGSAVDIEIGASTGDAMVSAVEVLDLPDDAFEQFCPSLPNSTGQAAEVAFVGSGSLGSSDLTLRAAPVPNRFGLFFYGMNETGGVPLGNGIRCVDAPFYRLPAELAAGGVLEHVVDFTNLPAQGQIQAGTTWVFQAWFRDPQGGGAGYNTSSALRMRFTD